MRTHLIIIAAVLALAGCGGGASVSQNQCIASDWQTLGYRDGTNGVNSSQLLAHQDACVKHGIIPDREGYMLIGITTQSGIGKGVLTMEDAHDCIRETNEQIGIDKRIVTVLCPHYNFPVQCYCRKPQVG